MSKPILSVAVAVLAVGSFYDEEVAPWADTYG